MGNIGAPEIIILLAIALLLFGAKRLPEIGRSLGSGMREFKDSVTGKSEEPPAELPPPAPTAAVTQPAPPEAVTTPPAQQPPTEQ